MIKHILLLAKRDFLQRGRSKGFLVMVGLSVIAILAVGPIIQTFDDGEVAIAIGLTGSMPADLEPAIRGVAAASERLIEIETVEDVAAGEDLLQEGDLAVLIVDGDQLVWADEPRGDAGSVVRPAIAAVQRQAAIDELGLSAAEAQGLLAPEPPEERRLEPEDPERTGRIVAGYISIFVLYIAILVFGQFVMLGVTEEKSSRVIEVVLSKVKPESILAGKIIGIGLLGLVQVLAMVGAVLVAVQMLGSDFEIPPIGLQVALTSILWFVLGYGFYSTMYAGLGATITRQEDMQGAAMLPAILILPAYFIALISLETPDSTLARISSLIPPTSPIVMPMRNAVTDVPVVENLAAVGIILATVVVLVKIAARIYRGAALRIGAKVPIREAWRAATR
ncbi:MAG: ABC transporter permease [Acidimicrobiia bacterium]|nr:ABC transporter permease [Acidimicrobiia bacterium]